jgi:hypothetical protein
MQIIYRQYLADPESKKEVMGCLSGDKQAKQYIDEMNKREGDRPWFVWSSEKTKVLRPIKHKPRKAKAVKTDDAAQVLDTVVQGAIADYKTSPPTPKRTGRTLKLKKDSE